ncbi:MAG: tetratricopeptide repeat protein [Pseudomonadota bacterium]
MTSSSSPSTVAATTGTPESFEMARQSFMNGIAHFERDDFVQAQAAFETSLRHVPGRASTLSNLAATHVKLGQPALALPLLAQALATEPGDASAWSHRGLALAALGQPVQALANFDQVLRLDPDNLLALEKRAALLASMTRPVEALAALDRLLALSPEHALGWWLRGDLLHRLERLDDALACYDHLLKLDPSFDRAWTQRGSVLKDLGRTAEAIEAFEKAMALGGDAAFNGYLLAGAAEQGGHDAAKTTPRTAPRRYVEALFDEYAERFDEHLVGTLGYQAHRVLIDQLLALPALQARRFESALDLGCGTGLCGPLIKPMAQRLEGVDLSAAMLARATATGTYDELAQADLVEHLAAQPALRHDLVFSADVFIYVGDLEPVFKGVSVCLQPQGVFCFSLEKTDDSDNFVLTRGMRYAHSRRYVLELAAAHGFQLLGLVENPVRHEELQPIDGLFVYLMKR